MKTLILTLFVVKKYIDVENKNQPTNNIINKNPAIINVPIALLPILNYNALNI
jgi:hypothetical protein